MLQIARNVLGEDARKVLEIVRSGSYEKRATHSTDKSAYSCSYSRWMTLHPVLSSAAVRIAACFSKKPGKFFVYRMDEGDHFRRHQDNGDHAVYYLSEYWQEGWGGVLELEGGERFSPEFDAVAVVTHAHPHWVTPVTVDIPRYTILVQC